MEKNKKKKWSKAENDIIIHEYSLDYIRTIYSESEWLG